MVQFEMSFIDKGGLDKVTGVGLLILETITIKDCLYYDVKFLSLKQHQLWELALPILEAINFRRWPMTSKFFNGNTKAMYYNSFFHLCLVSLYLFGFPQIK